MSTIQPQSQSNIRIGIFGDEPHNNGQLIRHPGLWSMGYAGSITHSGGIPVELSAPSGDWTWEEVLEEIDGVLYAGFYDPKDRRPAVEDALIRHCRDRRIPLMAIDNGMLMMNTTFGGTLYEDLPKEFPEALQHRQPPEEDIRHAINVYPDTYLASTYGEGEVVVNSEHRQAIHRLARGFRISGQALDNVIEAIEWENKEWFCMGVQWQPASLTASGLDIQVFRTLIDVASHKALPTAKPSPKLRRRLAKQAA